MKRELFALAMLCLLQLAAVGSDPFNANDRNEILFTQKVAPLPDAAYQYDLRHSIAWEQFKADHGTWYVEFNEYNQLPHRAYGKPIQAFGANAQEAAFNFIQNELGGFHIPTEDLIHLGTGTSSKYNFVHFKQFHQGLEVLFANTIVKLDQANRVVMFGSDASSTIDIALIPTITGAAAINATEQTLIGTVNSSSISPDLFILPIPGDREFVHHLVYEVITELNDEDGFPARYRSLIDAHDGTVLSRYNEIRNCGAHKHDHGDDDHTEAPSVVDVSLTSELYTNNPSLPATTEPLVNANVTVNGTTYTTDAQGNVNIPLSGPVTATFELAGLWSTVSNNGNTPSFTATLQDGSNAVSFDNDADIKELSAYFNVNVIHDYMKSKLPGSFISMDFSLPTNIDQNFGTCNASWGGSSIDFWLADTDCYSLATVGDVVYHEYGHGINDNFYWDLGGDFSNSSMHEGYADVWGFAPFEDPILADGHNPNDPDDFIRRYDINPKVYPDDWIPGVQHGNGEIIAGAWWDTHVLLGNDMDTVMYLFAEVYPGMQAETPNGQEGEAFRDVLLDVLQADDDDGDITNGTPNGNEIAEGFAIHGITLLSNLELSHDPVEASVENDDILIEAELDIQFPFDQYLGSVSMFYTLNDDPNYTEIVMTNVGPDNYEASIPGQPKGTLISYYIVVYDSFQAVAAARPFGAHEVTDPNIPYFVLIDMQLELMEDADDVNDLGTWITGIPSDGATTGEWELNIPVGSFTDPGPPIDFSTVVAPYEQHTPGGELCFLTGASVSQQTGQGDNDVDDGTTTLIGGPFDLTSYTNPVLSYYRWYTNNTGSTPGIDLWQAFLSDDGGSSWMPLEATRATDRSWRRYAVRLNDIITPTSDMMLKFNASDSAIHGGSIVEAALDDIQIWDELSSIGIEEISNRIGLEIFPNPAQDDLTVSFDLKSSEAAELVILNGIGQVVWSQDQGKLGAGRHIIKMEAGGLAEGLYTLDLRIGEASARKKLTIMR